MKTIGLTGGIGSGKTTVAHFFAALNIPVYIADEEAKNLMESDEEIAAAITAVFGEAAYRNGKPDRKFLAGQVFQNKEKLAALNAVVHPAVKKHFRSWKEKQSAHYVIYEAAILFETGGYKNCDFTILIVAPSEEKIKRLQKRDHSTEAEIAARMSNQWPDEKKLKLADFVIENTHFSDIPEKVLKIHHIILNTP